MRRFHPWAAACIFLSGCIQPALMQTSTVTAPQTTGEGAVVVRVPLADSSRAVLATTADIDQLMVQVRASSGAEFTRMVRRSQVAGNQAEFTFTQIPPGLAEVTLRAVNGAGRSIGAVTRDVFITSGSTAALDMKLVLEPTYVSGAPADGVLIPNIVFDAPVSPLTGTLVTISGSYLGHDQAGQAYTKVQVYTPPSYTYKVMKVLPDGTSSLLFETPVNPMAVDGAGNILGLKALHLVKLSPTGAVLFETSSTESGIVSIDPSGDIWLSSNVLRKYKADGTFVAEYPIPVHDKRLVFDKTGHAWAGLIKLTLTGNVVNVIRPEPPRFHIPSDAIRNQAIESGALSELGPVVDSQNNVWLTRNYEPRLFKYSPAGELLAEYELATLPSSIGIDAQDNIWMPWYGVGDFNLSKVSSNGVPLGLYSDSAGRWAASIVKIDAQNQIWLTRGISELVRVSF